MKNMWIIVADEARARIFSADSPSGDWFEQDDLVAPDARLRDRELASDRSGHGVGTGGQGHAFSQRHTPKEQAAAHFAERIARALTDGASNQSFQELVLIAPPRFLGLLRDALPERISRLVVHTLARELVSLPETDIRAHLPDRFGPARR